MILNTKATAQGWLSKHKDEMIKCPYQPGNLLISKDACIKRYQMAYKKDKRAKAGEFQDYGIKMGFSICRDCPIGKRLSLLSGYKNM